MARRHLATSGDDNISWWSVGTNMWTTGDIESASIELSAPALVSRLHALGWRLAMMAATLGVAYWYVEQIGDFLGADRLPAQRIVATVALCVALYDEPFSDLLALLRGGHSLLEAAEVTHLALAYIPLLAFAHVTVDTVRLRKRPAIVGFWLPKLLLLLCIALPPLIAWPLRAPATLVTPLGSNDGEVPDSNSTLSEALAYWLQPVHYDALRRPLEVGSLGEDVVALLCIEAIAVVVYCTTLALSIAAYLVDDDDDGERTTGRRNRWLSLLLALLTIALAMADLRIALGDLLLLEPQDPHASGVRLWLLNSLTWLVLIAASPNQAMRELIGTSRLRERAELWLRQAGQAAGEGRTEGSPATALLNDLGALTPEHKVARLQRFLHGFSLRFSAAEPAAGAAGGATPCASGAECGGEAHAKGGLYQCGAAGASGSSLSRLDDSQHDSGRKRGTSVVSFAGGGTATGTPRTALWLRQHMSCVLHFTPSWRLGTLYVALCDAQPKPLRADRTAACPRLRALRRPSPV
eukprot:6449842-Prymnesium_polylepis.1